MSEEERLREAFSKDVDALIRRKNKEISTLKNELKQNDAKIVKVITKIEKIIDKMDIIDAMVEQKNANIEQLKDVLTEMVAHKWNTKMTETELDNISAIFQRCDGRYEWKLGYKKGKTEATASLRERILKNERLFVVEHPEYGKSEPFGIFWEELTFHNPKDCGMSVILKSSDMCFSVDAKRFKLEILKETK